MARIGVFVCHCGENIGRTVRAREVAEFAKRIPGTVFSADYPYFCSAPGQKILAEAIKEAGLNPYVCEMANIREQCSWVHPDPDQATEKACRIVAATVERVKRARTLSPVEVPVTKRALVIGGGVAGIRAALDMANAGFPVVLVEREPSLGGNMARLSETFPTLDCSQCILTPLMVEASRHPRIEILTYSELEEVEGFVGNFKVRIRKKASFVRAEDCTSCNDCVAACPEVVPNEFDMGLAWRKAIYIPFPQAVPSTYTLDAAHCVNAKLDSETGFRVLACVRCSDACKPKAIDYDMRDEVVEREVGAIVVATGYRLLGGEPAAECGYGIHPDVVDGLEFERLLSASGPTNGEIRRPSDGKVPKDVVFIQCVGSRDPTHGVPYCSRICCMYTAKHVLLLKHKLHDVRATIFFMDVRAGGKGYEEFVQRVAEEERVLYVRGQVSQVVPRDGKLMVHGVDTLSGQSVQLPADMVVVALPTAPSRSEKLEGALRIPADAYGFFQELHPKLRPVETLTAGVYLAGSAQAPKDIPDAVCQASAAASKTMELLSQPMLQREPTTAEIDDANCVGCFECLEVCPYGAIERNEIRDRGARVVRVVARVNPAVCEGCGVCTVTCRNGNIDLQGCTDEQIFAQLGALGPVPEDVEKEEDEETVACTARAG
ncbi:MAG: 4Fe-4S dicluster domain-containing protein [Planctomycetota bacterium]|jgi:heterodisulfide reductase subunit A